MIQTHVRLSLLNFVIMFFIGFQIGKINRPNQSIKGIKLIRDYEGLIEDVMDKYKTKAAIIKQQDRLIDLLYSKLEEGKKKE